MTGLVIAAVAVLIVIWGVGVYNSLIRGRNQMNEAFSTMDVYMKKRFDLIPNLVETVKGYMKHEADTLINVTKMRSGGNTMAEKIENDKQVSQAIRGLMVQVEAYPQLQASGNFSELQQKLNEVENDIAQSRKYYNGCVRQYNDQCMMVPSNIIANMFHFVPGTLYEVESAEERKNVQVKF